MTNYSKNDRAEKILGKRDPGTPIDQPCELGYHCPVCRYPQEIAGNFDERLHWSEYNGMLWCSVCNADYPSCLCQPDPYQATEIFLKTIEDALERNRQCDCRIRKLVEGRTNTLDAIGGDQCKASTEKG